MPLLFFLSLLAFSTLSNADYDDKVLDPQLALVVPSDSSKVTAATAKSTCPPYGEGCFSESDVYDCNEECIIKNIRAII